MNKNDNNENKPEKQESKKQLEEKDEYSQCFETWRFFLGFRSTLLVFSFTITSALLYLFFLKDNNGEMLDDKIKVLIPCLGIVFTLAIITIELRNRQMYTKSIARARAIELCGETPPAFQYGSVPYFSALWSGTKDFFKDLRYLFIKKPEDNNPEENNYHLATLLIKTPIHLFSWMTGGILFMYFVMLIVWLILLFLCFIPAKVCTG